MSIETGSSGFARAEAEKLLAAGWTQGSLFRPNDHVGLPGGVDREDALLVVCTQACTLVSDNLAKDPWVEFAVALPVAVYAPRSEFATGRQVRRYHLPVAEAAFQAVEVDINSRFHLARETLLRFAPDGPKAAEEACRAFAGWIGRYYTRIALPNELVARLKAPVFDPLQKFLRAASKSGGAKHHEGLHSIYIRWTPSTELGAGESYAVDLLILHDEGTVADALESRLGEIGLDPDTLVEMPGLTVGCSVQARDETLLTDLDGWVRLSEWDHLSDLGDVAEMPSG